MSKKKVSRPKKSSSKRTSHPRPKKAARKVVRMPAARSRKVVKIKAHARKRVAAPSARPVRKMGVRAARAKDLAMKKKAAEAEVIERKKAEQVRVSEIVAKASFSEFLSQNIGKRAVEIINVIRNPQTDEEIAAALGMKINEARRILNVLSSYGVARYDANKDSKGWLTFEWYLDTEKLGELDNMIANRKPEGAYALPDNCNDFFYCTKCYEDQKIVLPFDAAFENQFKCDSCGNKLKQLNREEVMSLLEREGASAGSE
jgi:transcription factor E